MMPLASCDVDQALRQLTGRAAQVKTIELSLQ
jgi:hypothetical protein